jgi:hypothetical protein
MSAVDALARYAVDPVFILALLWLMGALLWALR